ncbi:DUF2130 domain-containing protein [Campylobacter pinnipediorum]|uniref:DUF2130 domain-containing protein n=1 Tax=Campylobacter pinnipediorum TaxID=1965231 RepID=UPI00084DFF83|nr:DUF2130 domain-containing protein [Campylobacter pinnipediorum]
MEKQSIKCPNCGETIDINDILYHKLESEFKEKNLQEKKKFEDELNQKRSEYKEAFAKLKEQELSIKAQEESFNERLEKATKELLKQQRQKLSDELKKELLEEQSESINLLKKELEEKSNQVKELNKSKAEIEKLKREKDEMESKIKAEAELVLSKQLSEEKAKIQKILDEQNELKFKQKEEQLEQLRKQLVDAQRKAEQGSQQLQGEVQELAIEEYLSAKFAFDTIEEIKKGVRGGDCVQTVHTREFQNCGKIYYESKRTKEFQRAWIEKFKADMREKGADVGVLVTEVLPKELNRMGLIDGVWVCTYEEFKGLAGVLREGIIKVYLAKKSDENKTDKMSLLYGYLTSNEFKMQIEAIVEGFTQMQSDLDSEKRSMQRIWKQREKQIEKVLDNTIGMYGSIKGIAGNSIGSVKALELAYNEKEEK